MTAPTRSQLDQILPLVYDELRGLASRAMMSERAGHSFQTTELVHEAYLRLAKLEQIDMHSHDHLIRIAIGVMRRVLIDYARKHNAQKRNPDRVFLQCPNGQFDEAIQPPPNLDLLALDEALVALREFDERKAEITELRYFGGQSIEDIARLLNISTPTVKRDWALARAWLNRELSKDAILNLDT